jgi:hypothetical protein
MEEYYHAYLAESNFGSKAIDRGRFKTCLAGYRSPEKV